MIDLVKVVELKVVGDHSLWLRFSDGSEGIRDVSDILAEGGDMAPPLGDPAFFLAPSFRSGCRAGRMGSIWTR
jgi:hypothetical protein